MAFPDSTWPCGGDDVWSVSSKSPEKVKVRWSIESFLRECQEEKKEIRSYDFGFAGATWNFFTSFDRQEVHSLFGINVKPHRLSNAVLDCNCEIEFIEDNYSTIKKIDLKFKYENADSHSAVTDFFSNSELDRFLQEGWNISCRIIVKKSSIKEACPRAEIAHSSISNTLDAHTLNEMLPKYSLKAFSDSSWTCGYDEWDIFSPSSEEMRVIWCIGSFVPEFKEERKELRSYEFGFAGSSWNFLTSLDRKEAHSLFGINVKPLRLSDAVVDCYCEIAFWDKNYENKIKDIECRVKSGSSDLYVEVQNFLSNSELDRFLQEGNEIECLITVKNSSIEEVCPEIAHSSSSGATEAHTLIQPLEKGDEELPIASFESKVCKDVKNLLLSGDDCDVTLQVHDQSSPVNTLG